MIVGASRSGRGRGDPAARRDFVGGQEEHLQSPSAAQKGLCSVLAAANLRRGNSDHSWPSSRTLGEHRRYERFTGMFRHGHRKRAVAGPVYVGSGLSNRVPDGR